MRRRDAARLRPGERVVVSDPDEPWDEEGVVVHATERGGVLVRMQNGERGWHPYHHVRFPDN